MSSGRRRPARKSVVWRSTSAAVVSGHISAMLWNGVMSTPAVRHEQVQVLLEVVVVRRRGLGAVARRRRHEPVLGAGAQLSDRPRHVELRQRPLDALAEPRRQGDHVLEGPSVSTSPSVARIAAVDRTLPASVPPTPPTSTRSASACARICAATASVMPYAPDGMPPPMLLPMTKMSGCEVPQGRAAARARRDRVRLVDEQQRAVLRAELAHCVEEARLGQHDADVGQRGLHDEHRDVTMCEACLDRRDVVELGDASRLADVHRGADVAAAWGRRAVRARR